VSLRVAGREDELDERASAGLLGRPPKQPLRLRAPGRDRAGGVDRDEGVGGCVEDAARRLLALQDGALGLLSQALRAGHQHEAAQQHLTEQDRDGQRGRRRPATSPPGR